MEILSSIHSRRYFTDACITFGHPLQQSEDGAVLDEGLGSEEVHGRGELHSGQLLLLQAVEVSVQLLLGRRQHHPASHLPERLLSHQQVPLGRVGHPICCSRQAQERHHDLVDQDHVRVLDHDHPPQDSSVCSWKTRSKIRQAEHATQRHSLFTSPPDSEKPTLRRSS